MPQKRRLVWKLYTSYFLITFAILGVITWLASSNSREFVVSTLQPKLHVPSDELETLIEHITSQIFLTGAVLIIVGALVTWLLCRRITLPLEEMRKVVERFARGDFQVKLPVSDTLELGGLAQAMNLMATELDERIRTVVQQQNEQQAILSSMVEGVVAVDRQERIIHLNRAAAELLGLEEELPHGKSIQEVVRNYDLHSYIQEILSVQKSGKKEITLSGGRSRAIQLFGAALRNVEGEGIGAVIVFHDLTEVRRLERIRRDFVANVSHELRTPITSIKGFVETLRDGAVDSPEDARRFLEIIQKQTDRLEGIIHDLLNLARIEQSGEQKNLQTNETGIKDLLTPAREFFETKGVEKQLRLNIECASDFQLKVNRSLIEQAVLNLVDNAIKYSDTGGTISIRAQQDEQESVIRVEDTGAGIAKEHLPRVFERFYRVDKSRTKKDGTGLGLAIVKHVALAHGGEVRVRSEPGQGTVFSIHLPRREQSA